MELKEFLHILYNDVGDCYIGVPYINAGKVVTEWFHSSNLDVMADYILEAGAAYLTSTTTHSMVRSYPKADMA